MKPQIDPKVDCVFKALLGSEEHTSLLVHFLNAVLARDPGIRIRTVELLNPYNEREFESDKLSVVDVKARDEQGRSYQVEIQLALHPGLTSRMLYTWSAIYHRTLPKGEDFNILRPVISIWLLNETLFDLPGAWHLPFVAWNREYGAALSDDFRIHVLQLPAWSRHELAQDDLDRWMYLFTEGEEVDAASPPAMLQTDEMKEAISVLQHFSENERQYFVYQQRLEAEHLKASWENAVARAQEEARQAAQQLALANEKTKQATHAQQEANRLATEAKREAEEAKRAAEEAKQHEAGAVKEAEQAKQQAERERQEKEQAKQQAEREQQEKERLLALLKQAGIDPNAS